jgi:hypothetical protein
LHPTVAEDQPGYDRAVSEDKVCPGQFSSARSDPGRSNQAAQNDSWSGPITALTWALEIGDVSRFRTFKQAIS